MQGVPKMFRIGLAGGIGSGKSEVAARLREHGALVIDADLVARELVSPGSPLLEALVEEFGDVVLNEDGSLDRDGLAAIAFASQPALTRLNETTRPALIAEILRRSEELERERPDGVLVVDAALLVQWGVLDLFDIVLVVRSDEETRVARLVDSGYQEKEARARMRSQLAESELAAAADVIIDNSGTRAELREAVDRFWGTLETTSEGRSR